MTEDEQEALSIAWNVARIVRLTSGNFALLTHYRAGALDILKIGSLEEIAPLIPTQEQCTPDERPPLVTSKKSTADLLADIGL